MLAAVAFVAGALAAQAPAPAAPYTVLSREGRRPLPVRVVNGQEMFALDDLARLFDLGVREDALAGGLIVTARNQTIVLSIGQGLASIGGRLISLPAAPARDGRAWFVPVDFVPRALSPALGTPLDLRKPPRLVVVGDVRVPRVAGRIERVEGAARLTLDVSPATPHTVAQDGPRVVVKFDADALDPALPTSSMPDLIQAVRPGESPASLTVDLGPRFGSMRVSDLPGDRGSGRVVIDIAGQTTEGTPAPQAPPPTPDAPPLLDLAPAGSLRTIVIDAGHGGDEHGARGRDGTLEKTVTLGVARRLKASLEARLGLRVILTRDGDENVGLDERAAVANNNKADIFLSLHANASVRPSAVGAEVFYLSLEEYGDEAQKVARGESEALPVFGGGTRDIEVILWEMAQARYIEQSAALAQNVEASLRERVPMSPRALQQAPFRVLVGANMPAVLVEMGFISNPEQEKQLSSDTFQNAVVQGLVDSIIRFRDAHGAPRRSVQPGTPPGAAR
ncbi:MAG: N-acetylmuramoyl-L-alanine amidase [Acidobacteria bacterium]|nr:N-acetylmuramoyl-L-alanine amidase [Acidobacteriota bacterium]